MTTFRLPQPAPLCSGIYYARRPGSGDITPVLFDRLHGSVWEFEEYGSAGYESFEWFGPVEECKEG